MTTEEIAARDLLVPRDTLEVRAFDYTPIPYTGNSSTIPAAEYDTLTIFNRLTKASLDLNIDALTDLIDALTELQAALPKRTT